MSTRLWWLVHNCAAHPIAGVLWFVGLRRLPDWLHESTVPQTEASDRQ